MIKEEAKKKKADGTPSTFSHVENKQAKVLQKHLYLYDLIF